MRRHGGQRGIFCVILKSVKSAFLHFGIYNLSGLQILVYNRTTLANTNAHGS